MEFKGVSILSRRMPSVAAGEPLGYHKIAILFLQDEDTMLQYKLCTFTVTQREFMNQHWYHCHTCKMVDGVGVCTVCARVCHRGHDVSYAKFGNFFCDCGAKPDSR